jgi:2-amino-4-hydroxy-6-hydroxymethyldihydropteridine diphosphokinase
MPSVRAHIGLGANLGDPAAQVGAAIEAIGHLPLTRPVAHSRLYASPAWGPVAQPDYVNAVAAIDTGLSAAALLQALLAIEQAAGRERRERWGPRRLDLDLLLYGDRVIHDDGLTVPHPRLHERAFVLLPLAEIAPGLRLPGLGAVEALLDSVDHSNVQALG